MVEIGVGKPITKETFRGKLSAVVSAMYGLVEAVRSLNFLKIPMNKEFSPFKDTLLNFYYDEQGNMAVSNQGVVLKLPLWNSFTLLEVPTDENRAVCLDIGHRRLKLDVSLSVDPKLEGSIEQNPYHLIISTTGKDLRRAGFFYKVTDEGENSRIIPTKDIDFLHELQCQIIKGEDIQQVGWDGSVFRESDKVYWQGFKPVTFQEAQGLQMKFISASS